MIKEKMFITKEGVGLEIGKLWRSIFARNQSAGCKIGKAAAD
jgi:hypothetical protein